MDEWTDEKKVVIGQWKWNGNERMEKRGVPISHSGHRQPFWLDKTLILVSDWESDVIKY